MEQLARRIEFIEVKIKIEIGSQYDFCREHEGVSIAEAYLKRMHGNIRPTKECMNARLKLEIGKMISEVFKAFEINKDIFLNLIWCREMRFLLEEATKIDEHIDLDNDVVIITFKVDTCTYKVEIPNEDNIYSNKYRLYKVIKKRG